jgi:enoyl-CoA hydratase
VLYETLTCAIADGIAVVTLNRPEAMNALSRKMKEELAILFRKDLVLSDEVRAVVLTGAGEKAFCAGADLKERSVETPPPASFYEQQQATHALFNDIAGFAKPLIAAINGVAFGGGMELALCCDIRIAAETARLGLTEVKLGVIPAGGGTQRLPRLIGAARAKELIFTGAALTASEALQHGIVSRVIAGDALHDEATALARDIAAQPPLAVRFAKRVIDQGQETDLRSALDYELYAASILFDTDDRKEGMKAFIEKRPPDFKGR